ncbi:MAG: Stp1/IreP family PP2C-type Ser/Thr phosphatase [Burkholderiales bacterium]
MDLGMRNGEAFDIAFETHPGLVRAHNEDRISSDAEIGLAVLADGMGGYKAGEVASGIAVSLIASASKRELKKPTSTVEAEAVELLQKTIADANTSIYYVANRQPQFAGMGTTLVTTLFYDNCVSVAHIGDSRLYRLRSDELERLTRDHSLLQEQLDSGTVAAKDAKSSRNKSLLTRALGIDSEVEPEIHTYPVNLGDIYLLCSDGLNDMVEDDEIQLTLVSLQANLKMAAAQLVQLANDNGGRDNISVILMKVIKDFAASRGIVDRCVSWLKH